MPHRSSLLPTGCVASLRAELLGYCAGAERVPFRLVPDGLAVGVGPMHTGLTGASRCVFLVRVGAETTPRLETTMANSKTIAGLIGPTLIALAAALLINLGSISALAESVSHDPALVLMSGVLSFVAGLAVVRVHNRRHESRSPRHTATSFIPG